MKNSVENRKLYNELICNSLATYLEEHPGIRFFQALWNLGIIERESPVKGIYIGIIDKYNEESEDTYKKLNL